MKRPNILMIGGEKGSWAVRGQQLGTALGAKCTVRPSAGDWHWADVVVFVKRAAAIWVDRVPSGCPVIWDVLDWWRQPGDNQRTVAELTAAMAVIQQRCGDVTMIGATQAMAEDIGGIYVSHHSRPGLEAKPIRKTAKVVAYEGRVKYLGVWGEAVSQACARLGLQFVINPSDLSQADIVVAFRDGAWDGPVCRRWKSGIKYVNAIAAGRPVITQPCAAFTEINPSGTAITAPRYVEAAIESWLPEARRQAALVACQARADEFSLDTITRQYRLILKLAMRRAAA